MDSIDRLYKNYDILSSSKENILDHSDKYQEILQAVNGSVGEKRLASQFITKFFVHFPSLIEKSIDCVLDLCEDEDVTIRKQAIKDLPQICRLHSMFLPKIADVLAQMFQSEDNTEIREINHALSSLIQIDLKGTLYGLFSQIQSTETDDNVIRECTVKFLRTKLKQLFTHGGDLLTKDVREVLVEETKKSLKVSSGEEFIMLVDIMHVALSPTNGAGCSSTGREQILSALYAQLQCLNDSNISEQMERCLLCVSQVTRYITASDNVWRFVNYLCPRILHITDHTTQPDSSERLALFKHLAQLSAHVKCLSADNCATPIPTKLVSPTTATPSSSTPSAPQSVSVQQSQVTEEQLRTCLTAVYTCLKSYVTLPSNMTEDCVETTALEQTSFQFSHIECLLFLLHCLGRHVPTFLTENEEALKDFRVRLQFLSRSTQMYVSSLRESLNSMSNSLSPQESVTDVRNKLKTALNTTSNINTLIKDLFHTPPIYKCVVKLSWLTQQSSPSSQVSEKRNQTNLVTADVTPVKRTRPEIKFSDSKQNGQQKKLRVPKVGVYKPPRSV